MITKEKMSLTLYSKSQCPYCVRAKQLLESRGVPFTEVNIEKDPESRQMLVDKGLRSVPQIFHGYELIPGGFDGLAKQSNEFFEKVKQ
jgi:glutaredoxin